VIVSQLRSCARQQGPALCDACRFNSYLFLLNNILLKKNISHLYQFHSNNIRDLECLSIFIFTYKLKLNDSVACGTRVRHEP
jgi:hypothetical protein